MSAVVRAARSELGTPEWQRPLVGPGSRSQSADPRVRLDPLPQQGGGGNAIVVKRQPSIESRDATWGSQQPSLLSDAGKGSRPPRQSSRPQAAGAKPVGPDPHQDCGTAHGADPKASAARVPSDCGQGALLHRDYLALQAELREVEMSLEQKTAVLHDIEDREGSLRDELETKERAVEGICREIDELEADLEYSEAVLQPHLMPRTLGTSVPAAGDCPLDCLIDNWVAPIHQARDGMSAEAEDEGSDCQSPSASSKHWGQARFAMGFGLAPPEVLSPTAMQSAESLRRAVLSSNHVQSPRMC
mmetsp:Transcript_15887/g.29036  ORF Transcript_15887/g.29036 Transcript_15887/m.29036 type:complete len:302 (-) Transcript_15887:67-972(-)